MAPCLIESALPTKKSNMKSGIPLKLGKGSHLCAVLLTCAVVSQILVSQTVSMQIYSEDSRPFLKG